MAFLDSLFKEQEYVLSNGKTSIQPRSFGWLIAIIVIGLTAYFLNLTGFNINTIFARGHQFWVLLGNMFPPNFNYTSNVWQPLIDTIKMSFLGTVIGSLVALPVAILSSTNIVQNKAIIFITRLILSLVRTIPTLVIALIAVIVLGLGTTAGTITIAIFTFGFIGKLLYEQIENVDMGAYEAMTALGCNKMRAFFEAIFPEVLPRYLSNILFSFEGSIRNAAILGFVGAGGIGIIMNTELSFRNYPNVGMILLLLFITVFVIETISRQIRKRLI